MSQKAICPRGHVWDPATLAGLPASDAPRCPVCGEVEAVRKRDTLGRLWRWCRKNPALAILSALCLLLTIALIAAGGGWLSASRAVEAANSRRESAGETRTIPSAPSVRTAPQTALVEANWKQKLDSVRNQLAEAERLRRDALQQRDEQVVARRNAEELARTAEQVRQEAVDLRRQTDRQLIGMHVAAGTRFMEQGDLSSSLLWFVEALRLAQREKMPEETHRLRLAAVLAPCARPVRMWMHEGKWKAVHPSGDGRRLLAVGADSSLRLFDAATGERVGDPLAHDSKIVAAALSPGGKRAATADADMMVHVWDLQSGKELFEALQRKGPLLGLAFSPDGRRFLTVGQQSEKPSSEVELFVWDAANSDAVTEQALGSEISPRPATFSPDGQKVLTICRDHCARLWDVATGKQIGTSYTHAAEVVQATFSGDGRRVLTASVDGTARVWNARTGEPATPPLRHGGALHGACFSPAGRFAATIGEDRRVRVWNAATGQAMGPELRHSEEVSQAIFSPDERYVLTICGDGAARIWDYLTGEEAVPALRHGEPILFAAFSPAGDSVLTSSGQVVRWWDLTAGEPPTPQAERTEVDLQVFSPDGKRVLRVQGTTAQIYDTASNRPVGAAMAHEKKVTAAAFSGDGRRVLTVMHQPNGDEEEGHVRVWETDSGKPVGAALVHPRAVLDAALSGDGRRVLTACQDQRARLWDADKGDLIGVPMEHKKDLVRALFVPGDRRLLTVDVEGAIRLWDEETKSVGPIWGHKKPVLHLEFSTDGRQIVTASEDGTARVWQADSGDPLAETAGHGAPVIWAAFSADGKRIATVSGNRSARVWDAATGKPITPPLPHRTALTRAVFSADGRWLITIAADGRRIYSAATGEAVCPLLKHSPSQSIASNMMQADARPTDDLLALAELLGGQRLAGEGRTNSLTDAELVQMWRQLREKYGKELAPNPARVVAWDRRGAAECEQRQLWQGAIQHLDRLLAGGPSAELSARRARANAALRR